ncbi:hypothetical protein HK101_008166 [Irineochytrium annulatum]|nr:hypothetical protein HK101_008166 [Irineochytrium annulatum]
MTTQIGFPKSVHDAYLDVLADGSATNWTIFTYDKNTNDLKVAGSGDGGLEELADEWEDSKIQYAFCKVVEPISKLPKFVLISWCGDGVPVSKKGLFPHHVNDVTKYFKGFHVHINARAEIDVSPDAIMKKVQSSSGAKYGIHQEKASKTPDVIAPVGSVYQPVKTNPRSLAESSTAGHATSSPSGPPPAPRNAASEIQQMRERREQEEREREQRSSQSRRDAEAAQEREDRDRADKVRREREQREQAERDQQRREEEQRLSAARRRAEEDERDRLRREEEERSRAPPPPSAVPAWAAIPAAPPSPPKAAVAAGAASKHDPPTAKNDPATTAVALYAYQAQEENEIDFDENETITGIEKIDEGWWQGVNAQGKMGLFPANYVQLLEAEEAGGAVEEPAAAAAVDGEYREATALYDYEAAEENEISFTAGDVITHIVFVSEDWWQGRVNGVEGLFPGNYVQL